MRTPFLLLIRLYQLTLGPFIGQRCRFHPSCSEYAHLAISKQGLLRGCWLTLKRLVKCGPWHPGGIDFPEDNQN
jgi:putative membrane protein insertion efficiency factor